KHFTWNGRIYWLRQTSYTAFGPFVNRNHFAGYISMLIPVPLALMVRAVRGQARLLFGFAAALMGTAAIISNSRSGVIGLGGSMVFMMILNTGAVYDRQQRRNRDIAAVREAQARQR